MLHHTRTLHDQAAPTFRVTGQNAGDPLFGAENRSMGRPSEVDYRQHEPLRRAFLETVTPPESIDFGGCESEGGRRPPQTFPEPQQINGWYPSSQSRSVKVVPLGIGSVPEPLTDPI